MRAKPGPEAARSRTLLVLAGATAIGSAGLAAGAGAPMAGLIVAIGGFAALSFAGTVVASTVMAVLATAFVRPPA